jgi:hypothetical protein
MRRKREILGAEAAFRREIAPWALLGLTLGLVEGATAAVLIKKTFADAGDPWMVNLAVAFVSGAPALSNVVSFVWANLAHGRARIGLMVGLQAGFAILVGLLGVAPRELSGLAFAVASILIARVVWTGILTVRAAVWSANYPRASLGRYTGRIVIVSSLAVSFAAALAAWILDHGTFDSRWLYGAGAAVVVVTLGTWSGWSPALWLGSLLLAFAYAGANLGWNLGHNDFASVGRAQHYMGVHVTLTGVRGAIGPPVGIVIYQWLESWRPGTGMYSLVLPLAFVTVGAAGFSHMRRVMERGAAT